MNNSVSDCCGKSDAIIAAVKLCVVAGDEVGSQNPDGAHGGRNVQTAEGNDADVSFDLRLLHPKCTKSHCYTCSDLKCNWAPEALTQWRPTRTNLIKRMPKNICLLASDAYL